jgi:hypothetical protein
MEVNGSLATARIERSGHPVTVRKGLTPEDAADLIRALEGEADVTVVISRESSDEDLNVAVDFAWAFLGLERLDGVFQFVARSSESLATQPFTVGGSEVEMESKYLSTPATAADVVAEWLTKGEDSAFGYWERQ